MKLFKILYKNFKLLLRSKSSAFTVFIGPVIIIALILFTFSSSEEISFSVGVIDTSGELNTATEFTESLVNEGYSLHEYQIVYDCVEDLKSSKVNLCLYFPSSVDELLALEAEKDIENQEVVAVVDDATEENDDATEENDDATEENGAGDESEEIEESDDAESLDTIEEAEETNDITKEQEYSSNKKQVVFYVDQSRLNIVESIMLSVGQNIEGKSEEMTEEKIKQIITEIGVEVQKIQSLEESSSSSIDASVTTNVGLISSESSESAVASKELQESITDAEYKMGESESNADLIADDYQILIDQLEELMDEVDSYVVADSELEEEYDQMAEIMDGDNITDNIATLQSVLSSLNSFINEVIANGDVLVANSDAITGSISEIETKIGEISSNLAEIESSANRISALSGENVENEYEIHFNEIVSSSDKSLFMFPYYLMLLIVFVGMMLASNLVNIEKQSLAFFRNHTSPTSNFVHLLARFGTNFSILLFQVIVVLIAAMIYLNIPVMNNFAVTASILLMTITFFIFLGYMLGYIFKTQEGLTIAFISVGSISAFLSNLILPIETFSQSIRNVLMYNPYMLSSELLKKSLIFESGFVDLGVDLWTLVIYLVLVIIIVLVLQRLSMSIFSLGIKNKIMLKRPHFTKYGNFRLEDGTVIENLEELVDALKTMKNDEYLVYGTGKDNEFALWIKDNFKLKKVAKMITKVNSRAQTVKLLNEHLKNNVKK